MDATTSAAVTVAKQRLAADLGCAEDEVTLLDLEAVAWSDSSLGCPRAGRMYLQVITPGYRITLEHNGRRYVVHTDRGRRAVRC